ncbi:SDR family NAD(P)-dependent oxidoreductase [Streptomyces javensis]|uniref:SDR family NAD(P)-dependent oxidoreductase n=1 Tax=Streptomyces javensis TaxID=114698 RepID=A0ABS0RF02_9ACTN|nr:SDR family NAD(P)-dependent oxidoreductase [Streptomyces javensis]
MNNAAIQINAPVEALPLSEWRRQFEVNLFGHIAVTQALLLALLRDGGRVVNLSSVGGPVAMATYGPYAGTKFASRRSATRCAGSWRRWACGWSSSSPARSVRRCRAG